MRKFGLFLLGGAVLLTSFAWVEGQQGQKKKGAGGFQFGGMVPGGGREDPVSIFSRKDVKKELEITDEQSEKLPAEVMVAISRVLNESQFKRFKQLELQKRGHNAFKDETVLKGLKATDEQKKSLISIVDESNKELAEMRKTAFGGGAGAGGFKGMQEKQATIEKETTEKVYSVLTKDQRKAWREMIGEKFTFEQPAFGFGAGGFGGFGKKGADKKDPE